jgi:hypothetical protein
LMVSIAALVVVAAWFSGRGLDATSASQGLSLQEIPLPQEVL